MVTTVGDAEGPFDLILESTGGPSLGAAFGAAIGKLAPGGTLVVLGNSSGEKHPFDFDDFVDLAPREARIEAFFFTSEVRMVGKDLDILVGLVGAGTLASQVGWEGSWNDAAQGTEALRERRVSGKTVFRIG